MPQETAKASLFVNRVPATATKQDIAAHFANALGIDASELLPGVRMMLRDDGHFKGTVFIDLADWKAVDRCLALNKRSFTCSKGTSRHINVREAVSKTMLEKISEKAAAPVEHPRPGKGKRGLATGDDHNGEVDPQRKKRREEEIYLKERRALQDMTVKCSDCGKNFVFTVVEQEYFLAQSWLHET